MAAGLAAVLSLGSSQLLAQDNNNNGGNNSTGSGGGGRGNRGNFDPAQFQQRIMDGLKDRLEVKDDAEWKALEPLIQKVMDARRDSMSAMGRGMFAGRNRGGNGGGGNDNGNSSGGRGGGFFGTPSPEAEALQKAIDNKAPNSEIKAALAKYAESKKAKQAELEKAQAELRKVLTVRQEAIASLNGLL